MKRVEKSGLLLSRRKGEAIIMEVSGPCVIEVVAEEVLSTRVRIRTIAPDCVRIHRKELRREEPKP